MAVKIATNALSLSDSERMLLIRSKELICALLDNLGSEDNTKRALIDLNLQNLCRQASACGYTDDIEYFLQMHDDFCYAADTCYPGTCDSTEQNKPLSNVSTQVHDKLKNAQLDLLHLKVLPNEADPKEEVKNNSGNLIVYSIFISSLVSYMMEYFGFEEIVNDKLKKTSPNAKLQYGQLARAYVIHMLCSQNPSLSAIRETASSVPMEILTNSDYPAKCVNRYAIGRLLDAINEYGAQSFTIEVIHEMMSRANLIDKCVEGHIDGSYIGYLKYHNQESTCYDQNKSWSSEREKVVVTQSFSLGHVPAVSMCRIVVNLGDYFSSIPIYTGVASGNKNDISIFKTFAEQDAHAFFGLYPNMSLLVGDSALAKVNIMRTLEENGVHVLSRASDSYKPVSNAIDKIAQGYYEMKAIEHTLSDGSTETYEACDLGVLCLKEARTDRILNVRAVGINSLVLFERKLKESEKLATREQAAVNSSMCKLFRGPTKLVKSTNEAISSVLDILKDYPLVNVRLDFTYDYKFDLPGMAYYKEVCDESNRIYECPKEDLPQTRNNPRLTCNFNLDIANASKRYTNKQSRYKYQDPPEGRVNRLHILGYRVKFQISPNADAIKQRAHHECIYVLINTELNGCDWEISAYYDKYHDQTYVERAWKETKDPDLFYRSINFKSTDRAVAALYFTSLALFFQRFLVGVFRKALDINGLAFSYGDLPSTNTPSWRSMIKASHSGSDAVKLVVEENPCPHSDSTDSRQVFTVTGKIVGFSKNLFAKAVCRVLPGFKEYFNLANYKAHFLRYIADSYDYCKQKFKLRVLDTPISPHNLVLSSR